MTKPLNINTGSGAPTSSNLVVWQGPNIPCISLCKGATVTDVVFKLATKLCEVLDTIDIEKYDLTCLNLTTCPPKDFEEMLQLLIERICELSVCPCDYKFISHTKSGIGTDLFYSTPTYTSIKAIGSGNWDNFDFTVPQNGKYKVTMKLNVNPQDPEVFTVIGIGIDGNPPTTNILTGSDFVGFVFKSFLNSDNETDWVDYVYFIDAVTTSTYSMMISAPNLSVQGLLQGFLTIEKVA